MKNFPKYSEIKLLHLKKDDRPISMANIEKKCGIVL